VLTVCDEIEAPSRGALRRLIPNRFTRELRPAQFPSSTLDACDVSGSTDDRQKTYGPRRVSNEPTLPVQLLGAQWARCRLLRGNGGWLLLGQFRLRLQPIF